MAMYWSEATTFMPMQLNTVVVTREPVDLTVRSRARAMTSSIRVRSMMPPKDRAHMMRATVFIMLWRPPPESSSSTAGMPVADSKP